MAKKATHCKLYQEQILGTDTTLNAFGVCPKCLWDIADHDHQGDFIILFHVVQPFLEFHCSSHIFRYYYY